MFLAICFFARTIGMTSFFVLSYIKEFYDLSLPQKSPEKPPLPYHLLHSCGSNFETQASCGPMPSFPGFAPCRLKGVRQPILPPCPGYTNSRAEASEVVSFDPDMLIEKKLLHSRTHRFAVRDTSKKEHGNTRHIAKLRA